MSEIEFLSDKIFRTPFYVSSLLHQKGHKVISRITPEQAQQNYEIFIDLHNTLKSLGFLPADDNDKNMRFSIWGEPPQISNTTKQLLRSLSPDEMAGINRVVRTVPMSSPAFLSFIEKDEMYNGKYDDQVRALEFRKKHPGYGYPYAPKSKKFDCYHLSYVTYDLMNNKISAPAYYGTSMSQKVLYKNTDFIKYMDESLDIVKNPQNMLQVEHFKMFMSCFAEEIHKEAERFGFSISPEKFPKVLPMISAFTRRYQIFGANGLIEDNPNYSRAINALFKIVTSDIPVELGMVWASSANYPSSAVGDPTVDYVMELDELEEFAHLPFNNIRSILGAEARDDRKRKIEELSSILN